MKRVLVFSVAYAPLVGGAEVAIREITDRLEGWEVGLVCARLRPGLATTERIGNVTVHRVGFGKTWDKYLFPFLGAWHGWRLFRAGDVLLVWSMLASYAGFASVFYLWARPRTPFVLSVQEGDPLESYAKRLGLFGFLQRWVFRRADALLPISRFLEEWARRMGFVGASEVVPNGVDVGRFVKRISSEERAALRTAWGVSASDVVILTTSRLVKKNAVDDLVRSLAELPPTYRLVVAGTGDDKSMLDTLASSLGVTDRITWLGDVSQTALPATLQAADVFVRASRSEGLGISFLEALASGVPIVGTPVGGIPDFLVDGKTGVFAQPNDPASIAASVRRIQETPGLRETLINQGTTLMRERYDWTHVATRAIALLERTATGASSGRSRGKILAVLLAVGITASMGWQLGQHAYALAPLYTDARIRGATQAALETHRTQTGIGLTYYRFHALSCDAQTCSLSLERLDQDGERTTLTYAAP